MQIDNWSIGCIMGELMSRKTMFPGRNGNGQLDLITNVCGGPSSLCDTIDTAFRVCGSSRPFLYKSSRPFLCSTSRLCDCNLCNRNHIAIRAMLWDGGYGKTLPRCGAAATSRT